MIGQEKLLAEIRALIEKKKYPRFSIIIGNTGSGRKTLAKEVAKMLDIYAVQAPDVKAETIRTIISDAYKLPYDYMYIVPDADSMSTAAKNALLKVTEEPPNNAYFIMTAQDESNLLDTLKSRGSIFRMGTYTPEEIAEYANCDNTTDLEVITSVCEVPGDVDIMKSMDPMKFYSYAEAVVQNIAETSGSNSFKIAEKINLKDDKTKFDLALFWRTFMLVCLNSMKDAPLKYAEGVKITSRHLQELKIKGINKASLFDTWILSIREAWM